jgi:hypothetical protein
MKRLCGVSVEKHAIQDQRRLSTAETNLRAIEFFNALLGERGGTFGASGVGTGVRRTGVVRFDANVVGSDRGSFIPHVVLGAL